MAINFYKHIFQLISLHYLWPTVQLVGPGVLLIPFLNITIFICSCKAMLKQQTLLIRNNFFLLYRYPVRIPICDSGLLSMLDEQPLKHKSLYLSLKTEHVFQFHSNVVTNQSILLCISLISMRLINQFAL